MNDCPSGSSTLCPFAGRRPDGDYVFVGRELKPGEPHGVPGASVGVGEGERVIVVPADIVHGLLGMRHP